MPAEQLQECCSLIFSIGQFSLKNSAEGRQHMHMIPNMVFPR